MVRGAVALLVLLITACAPKLVGVWRDPGFTPSQIHSAQVVLGGIGSSAAPRDINEEQAEFQDLSGTLDRILWKQLEKKAPNLALLPLEFSRDKLGADKHAALVAKFDSRGELTPEEAMSLSDAVKGQTSYVLYGRLAQDRTESTRILESSGWKTDYKRRMAFAFAVYEVSTGKAMWRGALTLVREDRVSEDEESGVDSFGDLVTSLAAQLLLPQVEEAISTQKMVKDIFGEFAKQLVEEK